MDTQSDRGEIRTARSSAPVSPVLTAFILMACTVSVIFEALSAFLSGYSLLHFGNVVMCSFIAGYTLSYVVRHRQ